MTSSYKNLLYVLSLRVDKIVFLLLTFALIRLLIWLLSCGRTFQFIFILNSHEIQVKPRFIYSALFHYTYGILVALVLVHFFRRFWYDRHHIQRVYREECVLFFIQKLLIKECVQRVHSEIEFKKSTEAFSNEVFVIGWWLHFIHCCWKRARFSWWFFRWNNVVNW